MICFLLIAPVCGFQIARRAPDLHGFFLASGITFMILVYALVNMGVCTGLIPATGLPLPFISYGGSSLLFTLLAVWNPDQHRGGEERPTRERFPNEPVPVRMNRMGDRRI